MKKRLVRRKKRTVFKVKGENARRKKEHAVLERRYGTGGPVIAL
jgi:hypothetical protein